MSTATKAAGMDVTSTLRRVLDTNPRDELTGFQVLISGQVELARFPGQNNLYCKYDFTYGPDWRVVHGIDKGISQIASKADGTNQAVVWNFPVDVVFKSTSAHGWPRLVVSVFGLDALGRDVVRGYGSVHIPTRSGRRTRTVRMFRPVPTSRFQQFISWLQGTQPEFFDSRFVSRSQGRESTVVRSAGSVQINLNVMTRGMRHLGYHDGRPLQVHLAALQRTADSKSKTTNNAINDSPRAGLPNRAPFTSMGNTVVP